MARNLDPYPHAPQYTMETTDGIIIFLIVVVIVVVVRKNFL